MADPLTAPMLRFLFLETMRPVTRNLGRWLYTTDSEVRLPRTQGAQTTAIAQCSAFQLLIEALFIELSTN